MTPTQHTTGKANDRTRRQQQQQQKDEEGIKELKMAVENSKQIIQTICEHT